MFLGAIVLLVGTGIGVQICSGRPQEISAGDICMRRFNLSEEVAGIIMFATVSADELEVVAQEKDKCLINCMAREAGYLNAKGEFTVSEFIEKEVKHVELEKRKNETAFDEEYLEEMRNDHESMMKCAKTVENWNGWNRKKKCHKGYLFFKCKSYGVEGFQTYMELQRKIAAGEIETLSSRFDQDYDTLGSSSSSELKQTIESMKNFES